MYECRLHMEHRLNCELPPVSSQEAGLGHTVLPPPRPLGRTTIPQYAVIMTDRRPYPSDLSDARWALVELTLTTWRQARTARALAFGRPPEHELRDLPDAILYVDRTGILWRYLPHDYPPLLWNPTCQVASKNRLVDMCWPLGSKAGRLMCCEHGDLWFRAVLPDRGRRDSAGARITSGDARW
ncbi:hypothetical protein GCM10010495_77620 [Kitasatospora herbaricolor]|nr:hypothetical protein GCM10010495_77620 [Kitasatospora herbaricolor]